MVHQTSVLMKGKALVQSSEQWIIRKPRKKYYSAPFRREKLCVPIQRKSFSLELMCLKKFPRIQFKLQQNHKHLIMTLPF